MAAAPAEMPPAGNEDREMAELAEDTILETWGAHRTCFKTPVISKS